MFSEPDPTGRLTRRQLLGLLAAAGGAALLNACGASAAPSTGADEADYSIFRGTMVDMAWPAVKQAAADGAAVLLPLGIIEEHGPHLALGVDTYAVTNWCQMLRPVLAARGIPALIAPPLYWGISPQVADYPGTFSVRGETLSNLLYDVHASLARWGFRCVFNFNSHGDTEHKRVFQQTLREINQTAGIAAYYVCPKSASIITSDYVIFQNDPRPPASFKVAQDVHAGAYETAEMLAFFPNIVDTAAAKTLPPTSGFDPQGYWGDPARYDEIPLDDLRKWVDDLVSLSADAIEGFLKENPL